MYTLKTLPFSFYELEPFIDTHTIDLHYHKHQAPYLNNLNKILEKYNFNYPIEDLYDHLNEIKDKDNTIDLMTTSNQDSTKLYGFTPLLTLVLWEHAYYLNYENDKLKYFDNFKTIVNFNYANKLFN